MKLIVKLYESLVRGLMALPYGFSFNRERWANARSARNTIQLCRDIGLTPQTLVDVGAHNGEWAYWIRKQWPWVHIIAFEPHPNCRPIAHVVHRVALGSMEGHSSLTDDGASSHVSLSGKFPIEIRRFDLMNIKIMEPAILKIDAETYTAMALDGFGETLGRFSVIVVEMWNYYPGYRDFVHQQDWIWSTMLKHKVKCRVVDSEWTAGAGIPTYDAAFY